MEECKMIFLFSIMEAADKCLLRRSIIALRSIKNDLIKAGTFPLDASA